MRTKEAKESLSDIDIVESRRKGLLPVDEIQESTKVVSDVKIEDRDEIKDMADLNQESNPDVAGNQSLSANDDTDPVADETYDLRIPTAPVVLASSSTIQQSREDPELGHHVVEAVCVQDQNVLEAEIVTDDDKDGRKWKCSSRTILFIAALVSLGIMTTSLIVVLRKRNQAVSPTAAPAPTISSEDVQRIDTLRKILAPLSGENVFDENSAEFSLDRKLALDWMVRDTLLSTDDLNIEWKVRQRYVVALLYITTNGPKWKDQFYFDTRLPECDWSSVFTMDKPVKDGVFATETDFWNIKGIICNRGGRIDRIRLWWNNLTGTLPHELSEFSESLVEFNVGGGSISGHIPRSFEKLTNLEWFACNDNCLTGVIPDLSDATRLTELRLNNNGDLSGALNNFCSGPDLLAPMSQVLADCKGSIECDCCNCCNQDVFECCLPDGTCQSSINLNALTSNNVLSSFDKQCLSENSKQWIQDECPCFYNNFNETIEGDDVGFQAVCTQNCNADGASRSYDF